MKIAIFSDTFFPQVNGVANVAYGSAVSLSKLGHEVVVFVPVTKTEKKKIEKNNNFKVITFPSIPLFFYPGLRMPMLFSIKAYVAYRKFKPDIVHTHTPFTVGWSAVLFAKLFGTKLVGTHHTFYDHYLKIIHMDYAWGRKFSWKYTNFYYNLCDLVLSPTQSLADELVSHGLHKPVKILVNSIDMEMFRPSSENKKKHSVVYMGRLSYEKSIDVAMRAFVLAREVISDVTMMIVGDGPEKNNLMALSQQLGVSGAVSFTGVLRGRELAEALNKNELFITASASENMPLSTLEGQACGLPLIAVSEKGMKEIVTSGVNGLLSPAHDTIYMSENILKLLQNHELLAQMSIASRVNAEKHSEKTVTELLVKIYQNLL